MLRFCLCFLSFFYTVNSFSTEEKRVKKKCDICLEEFEENNSSSLKKTKEIFFCNCEEDHFICKECLRKYIVTTINSKKEEELTENNEKINILDLIFYHIRDQIENNNNLKNFVKYIIHGDKKIGKDPKLNAERELVYNNITEKKDEQGNTIFHIDNEKEPTAKLKFIKSFLSLLKEFDKDYHSLFTRNIEWSISQNCHQEIKIKEIEEWEKDVEINLSVNLDTTELQEKIKNEKVISIICPSCKRKIEKESDFFLKICGEPSPQELSKKFSCLKYCGNICSDCF